MTIIPESLEPYEIIIAGGGPAGSVSACILAKAGFRVLLLEAGKARQRKVCGEFLCYEGGDILRKIDLFHVIENNGFLPARGVKLFNRKGKLVTGRFPQQTGGYCLNRALFDESLLKEAERQGAQVLHGVWVGKITRTERGWEVFTRCNQKFKGDLLVGADGIHSVVAMQCGKQSSIKENVSKQLALRCFLPTRRKALRLIEMHLLPRGNYIGINGVGAYEVNFSIVLDKKEMQAIGNPVQVVRRCFEAYPHLGDNIILPDPLPEIAAISPVTHRVKSCIADNAVLIGDAGGFTEPLTGDGITIALWTASAMAERLIRCKTLGHWRQRNKYLKAYQRAKHWRYLQKRALAGFLKFFIRQERLCGIVCRHIGQTAKRRQALMGVFNNTYSPLDGLSRILLDILKIPVFFGQENQITNTWKTR